jgi:hypothetical protein
MRLYQQPPDRWKVQRMSDTQERKPSWFQTLPGVLTAFAAVITALTGLIVGLAQSHIFDSARTAAAAPNPAPSAQLSSASAPSPAVPEPAAPAGQPRAPAANSAGPGANAAGARPSAAAEDVPERRRPIRVPEIDLLTAENGGHVVAATSDNWKITIDGDDTYHCCFHAKGNAVYAFKDGKAASFDTFASFIDETRPDNARELELAVGNDSPTGEFRRIATCTFQNIKMFEMPYQECKFPAVRAKYLKVIIVSNFGNAGSAVYLDEFKLMGTMN